MTIQLATSLIFLVSSIYGPAALGEVDNNADTNTAKNSQESVIEVPIPLTLEDYVKEYFKDDPILAEIARCESQFRHTGKTGNIIRGKVNPADVGLMQINEKYHAEQAKKLGYDIYSLEGNMAYAKWLYDKEHVKPWKSSSKCWQSALAEMEELAVAK